VEVVWFVEGGIGVWMCWVCGEVGGVGVRVGGFVGRFVGVGGGLLGVGVEGRGRETLANLQTDSGKNSAGLAVVTQ